MGTFINSIVVLLLCDVFGAVTDEKLVSVIEGEAVTLYTEVTKQQESDKIRWRFGEEGNDAKLIAEMSGGSIIYKDVDDGRFKDRLQILDLQTGDLIIKNMRHKHTGRYKLDFENKLGTTTKIFRVTVKDAPRVIGVEQSEVKSVSVNEGESVTLHTEVQTQRGDLIVWRFGPEGVLIAKVDKEEDKSLIDDDERIRGRLKLDQSGSLTITNTKTTDAGVYKLQIIDNRDTKNKIFNVYVSERGLSAGEKAGIIIGALLPAAAAAAAVGVILYRRKNYARQKLQERIRCVELGDAVTLDTDFEIVRLFYFKKQTGDVIQWRFGDEDTPIAQFTIGSEPSYISTDERFRDRLELNPHNGHLTITNITTKLTGDYKATIISRSRGTQYRTCKVAIQVNTYSGESVTLCPESQIYKGSEIKWIYEEIYSLVTGMGEGSGTKWVFGDKTCLVAGKKEGSNWHKYDKRFRGRLEINSETGDLTIRDIRLEDCGLYILQLKTTDGKISYTRFHVWISGNSSPKSSIQASDEKRTEENDSTSVEMTPLNAAEDRF